LASFAIIGSAGADYWLSNIARNWPNTQGQVLDSKLMSQSGRFAGSWAEVRYTYNVSDREYVGSTIRFGPELAGSRAEAEATVSKFSAGKHVPVYFKPEDPSVSVLEPGALHTQWAWKAAAGFVLTCASGVLAFVTWKAR
jgi:hypothetical protein